MANLRTTIECSKPFDLPVARFLYMGRHLQKRSRKLHRHIDSIIKRLERAKETVNG